VKLPAVVSPLSPAQSSGSSRAERGLASWFNTADETCAHRTAPFGTVIKVTRLSTGAVTHCTVNDWGPADTTRVIDLSMDSFEQLADAGAGLIDVAIEW
jgi:rare lipoprotein A